MYEISSKEFIFYYCTVFAEIKEMPLSQNVFWNLKASITHWLLYKIQNNISQPWRLFCNIHNNSYFISWIIMSLLHVHVVLYMKSVSQ